MLFLPVFFAMFEVYNIMSCDMSYDHGHIFFYCSRNKRKEKTKQN